MSIKLGIGPYERNAPETMSTVRARIYFLRVTEVVEPEVVASLHDEVFLSFLGAVYVNLGSQIKINIPFDKITVLEALQGIRGSVSTEAVQNLVPNTNALGIIKSDFQVYTRLTAWAEKWGLREEWCLDYAVRAMRMWLYWETQRVHKSWWRADSSEFASTSNLMSDAIWEEDNFISHIKFIDYVSGGKLANTDFTFEYKGVSYRHPGWSLFYEEAGEWKKNVRDEFKTQLRERRNDGKATPKGIMEAFDKRSKEHVDFLKSAAKKYGLKLTPKKRDVDHFRWLVHYHVQEPNWSLNNIAEKYNADPKTISDGIKRTAQLIGLTLRKPLRAGRKRRQA